MPRRNSPVELRDLVVDRRLGRCSAAQKSQQNRQAEKQCIRQALTQKLLADAALIGEGARA